MALPVVFFAGCGQHAAFRISGAVKYVFSGVGVMRTIGSNIRVCAAALAICLLAGIVGCGPKEVEPAEKKPAPQSDPIAGQVRIDYHNRAMELDVNKLGYTRVETASSADVGIETDGLTATFDITNDQWRDVFRQWFCEVCRLPKPTQLHPNAVTISKHFAWEYTYASQGPGTQGSLYWRVYVFPRGRQALVVRSIHWQAHNQDHLKKEMESFVSDLDYDSSFVW